MIPPDLGPTHRRGVDPGSPRADQRSGRGTQSGPRRHQIVDHEDWDFHQARDEGAIEVAPALLAIERCLIGPFLCPRDEARSGQSQHPSCVSSDGFSMIDPALGDVPAARGNPGDDSRRQRAEGNSARDGIAKRTRRVASSAQLKG